MRAIMLTADRVGAHPCFTRVETQSSPTGSEGKEKALSRLG